jgi:hypothetical protein
MLIAWFSFKVWAKFLITFKNYIFLVRNLLFSDKIENFDVENHKLVLTSKFTYEKLINSGYHTVYDCLFIAKIVIKRVYFDAYFRKFWCFFKRFFFVFRVLVIRALVIIISWSQHSCETFLRIPSARKAFARINIF